MSERIEEPKSGKGKIIIGIVIALVIVGVGAFLAYSNFSKKKISNNQVNQQPPVQQQVVNQNMNNMNSQMAPIVPKFTYDMGELLINLSDDGGRRYLKISVTLGYENKKLAKELETKKQMLADAINSVLRSKQAKDFNPKGTEKIKEEILSKINVMFENGRCDTVFFPQILVQ